MAAFRLDTAAAIRKLEGAGVDGRQAAAIVELHAAADAELATKTDLQLVRNELKADIDERAPRSRPTSTDTEVKAAFETLSQRIDANQKLLSQQLETGFAEIGTALADLGTALADLCTEQRHRDNVVLGRIVAMGAVILAGMAIF